MNDGGKQHPPLRDVLCFAARVRAAEGFLKSERRQVIDLTALSGCGDRI
jgi:hypothetical protein